MSRAIDPLDRRGFLSEMALTGAALSAGALLPGVAAPAADDKPAAEAKPAAPPPHFDRQIKVGIVGCGGRGSWIANLFHKHGGYQFVAAADYHQERATKTGAALGVAPDKCFAGLSGYRRLMESGVEAVILETPVCFFQEHAPAAVEAGLHVYMAKPVAADVPGTMKIGAAGRQATARKKVFLVDYQMPRHPLNQEVARRVREGALGQLQMVYTTGRAGGGGIADPPLGPTIENRLVSLIWCNDDALGGGHLVNFDVHSIDAMLWVLGRRPVSAYGRGGRFRNDPHGDSFDTYFVTFTMDDGLTWHHESAFGPTHEWVKQGALEAGLQGADAAARLSYWQKAYLRGGPQHFGGGPVQNLYEFGASANIAAFYQQIIAGDCRNATVDRSVDSTLTCLLAREAARRGGLLTMDELIKENRTLPVDLRGLRS